MLTKDLTYNKLFTNFKKGLRNGNWRKLRFLDKALYRAAMGYAKRGRSIVNGMLVEKHFFQKEIFTKETILNYFIQFIYKYKNNCKHESGGAAEKVWLPYELEGRSKGLVPHSYRIHCGVVKKMSSKNKKAKRMGYYTNIKNTVK